ncbi:MAG TPA: hypothetical protein VF331_10290 [Polyangiales bacterium]
MNPRDRERHVRRRRAERATHLKDRLIQTRVPGDLESALKEEARKRRLSVSHLIRNVLEDTFQLVDNVVLDVDNLVQDSVGLARQVRRDAERIAHTARSSAPRTGDSEDGEHPDEQPDEPDSSANPAPAATAAPAAPQRDQAQAAAERNRAAIAHVMAWNQVVLNTDARCALCAASLPKGSEAHLGLSQVAGLDPTWLCTHCLSQL